MITNQRGSVLAVVCICTAVIVVIVASLLSLINTQRRLGLRKEVMLQAYEAAESSADYAYSYVINDIGTNTLAGATSIPSTGNKSFTFGSSALDFLGGTTKMPSGHSDRVSNVKLSIPNVRVLPAGEKNRYLIDGKKFPDDPNKNQWIQEQLIPVISSATATHGTQQFTAYLQKSISSREIALFQYAIFFQGQLHLHRGFGLMGGVHANGNLFLNAHDGDKAIYNGTVSSGHHFYRGSTFDQGGTGSDSFGYVAITSEGKADLTTSPAFSPKVTGTNGALKIYVDTINGTPTYADLKNLDSRTATWKDDATTLFNSHLGDKAMEVPLLSPIGTSGYTQDVAASTDKNEFNNAPYALLEPTLPVDNPNHQSSLVNNLQARASLLLIVEYNSSEPIKLHKISNGESIEFSSTTDLTAPDSDLSLYSDPWRMFVVKAYRVDPSWSPALGTDIHEKDSNKKFRYLIPVTLPTKDYHVIGRASPDCTKILSGMTGPFLTNELKFEDFGVAFSSTGGGYDAPNKFTLHSTDGLTVPFPRLLATQRDFINNHPEQSVSVVTGLFDSRLGRGVAPITIDIDALKKVMEAPLSSFSAPLATNPDYLFRTEFDPTAILASGTGSKYQWNGLIYIEFPTSLTLQDKRPLGSIPQPPAANILNNKNGIVSRQFAYSTTAELLHPDRWDSVDNFARRNRTDKIVPMAKELRRYPPKAEAHLNTTILAPQYAIPAVQIINGGKLPHPNPGRAEEGFTIATNAPLYLIGNYNSDGDYTTGTNVAGTSPDSYATADPGWGEIPAAFFCDTFTVLSNGWGARPGGMRSNRENSFYGANRASTRANGSTAAGTIAAPPGRPSRARPQDPANKYSAATPYNAFRYPASGEYVEISACIATGEYPIFEFFNHALENYSALYNVVGTTKANPIIFKGSVVALFHSEIQHIKQAYGRDVNKDIQYYWEQHGASAICAVRYHDFLVGGNFPPGTPMLYVTRPKDFRLLRWSDAEDAAVLTKAGYTAP